MRRSLWFMLFLAVGPSDHPTVAAQSAPASRIWRSDERTLLTDLSVVTAVAANRTVVYAATLGGLAVYDRGVMRWRETIVPVEGAFARPVTTMVADPNDDTAWMAGVGFWARYQEFGRRLDGGPLPGAADQVVLDARNPSGGAWFRAGGGWYFVARGSLAAVPASNLPPPASRLVSMTPAQLRARLPAFDAIRFRVERDEQGISHRITAGAVAPLTNELYLGTDGNGAFRVDPVTYSVDRLPAGLLGTSASAVAAWRGQVCSASDARIVNPRRGITCYGDDLGSFNYYEAGGQAGMPLASVRQVLVTERAIWAATDQGVIRAPRRGGRAQQFLARDGLPSSNVEALAAAPEGAWVGTSGGLALLTDTGRTVVVAAQVTGPPVLALAWAGTDTLWAGTTAGLVAFLLPIGGPVAAFGELASGLRETIVAVAVRGDTVVAASGDRLTTRTAGEWRTLDAPGRPVGTITRVVPDERAGFWVAGTLGLAYFDPGRNVWSAWTSPGDVPLPVHDVAATRNNVWVATGSGIVRFDRRVLMP